MTHGVVSQRFYMSLMEIWEMVARTAPTLFNNLVTGMCLSHAADCRAVFVDDMDDFRAALLEGRAFKMERPGLS